MCEAKQGGQAIEIEITPSMIEAGRLVVQKFDADIHDMNSAEALSAFLRDVFTAMMAGRSRS